MSNELLASIDRDKKEVAMVDEVLARRGPGSAFEAARSAMESGRNLDPVVDEFSLSHLGIRYGNDLTKLMLRMEVWNEKYPEEMGRIAGHTRYGHEAFPPKVEVLLGNTDIGKVIAKYDLHPVDDKNTIKDLNATIAQVRVEEMLADRGPGSLFSAAESATSRGQGLDAVIDKFKLGCDSRIDISRKKLQHELWKGKYPNPVGNDGMAEQPMHEARAGCLNLNHLIRKYGLHPQEDASLIAELKERVDLNRDIAPWSIGKWWSGLTGS